jgi:hypothetical protein
MALLFLVLIEVRFWVMGVFNELLWSSRKTYTTGWWVCELFTWLELTVMSSCACWRIHLLQHLTTGTRTTRVYRSYSFDSVLGTRLEHLSCSCAVVAISYRLMRWRETKDWDNVSMNRTSRCFGGYSAVPLSQHRHVVIRKAHWIQDELWGTGRTKTILLRIDSSTCSIFHTDQVSVVSCGVGAGRRLN